MNNQNGQVLTQKIAQKLIQELFAGQTVELQEIRARVDAVHMERGGLPSNYKRSHPVSDALSRMKRIGLAENPQRGYWFIFSEESSQSEGSSESGEPDPIESLDELIKSLEEGSSESGEPDPIESLNGFMKWIEELPPGEYVYRGVSNERYPIEASTYRRLKDENGKIRDEDKTAEKLRQINQEMIEEANRHRHGWENGQPPSDLNLLAKLQHSGAATCLIDFTNNPLVALWMAGRKSSRGSVDGKVYAVKIGPRSQFEEVSSQDALKKKIYEFFQSDEKTAYKLYQWQPHYQDNRMLAQQSIFLFGGGWDAIKASEWCVISEKHKKEIWDSLKKSAGISGDILFPDFEGFASQRAQNKAYDQPDAPVDKDPVLALPANVTAEITNHELEEIMETAVTYHLDISLEETRAGNIEAAVHHYNEAMKFEPSSELINNYHQQRAVIYHDEGYLESAINDYSEAIRLNANDGDSYFGRGRVNYDLGKYTEAISDFGKAIDINPENAYTYYWRGLAKYDLGQYPEAVVDFDRAINLNPADAYFYYWRGLAAGKLSRYPEAIVNFDRAINLNPTHVYSYHGRALAKRSLGQYPEAIIDFDRAINLNPTDAFLNGQVYYWRGLAKNQMGLLDAADDDFRTALMCAEEAKDYDLMALIRQELSS